MTAVKRKTCKIKTTTTKYTLLICALKTVNRRESLRHVAMVTKFLELNRPWTCKYGRKQMKNMTVHNSALTNKTVNLVPRVFSLSNMAAAGEKTLGHSRNHVTDLSTESGNLFKMAAKIKSERIWVRGLELRLVKNKQNGGKGKLKRS